MSEQELTDHLRELEVSNLTSRDVSEVDNIYTFKHSITRDAVYQTLLMTQRRQMHRSVAEWYEQTYADDLSPHYLLLAHHYERAAEGDEADAAAASKAVDYLDKAAERALARHANSEAANLLERAIALEQSRRAAAGWTGAVGHRGEIHSCLVREARWERLLGEAYFDLGRIRECGEHYRRALKLLNQPAPTSTSRLLASLLKHLLIQVAHRLWPARFIEPAPKTGDPVTSELALNNIGAWYMYNNDQGRLLWDVLRATNLSESAGLPSKLTSSYSALAVIAGAIPWPSLANDYLELAWGAYELTQEPACLIDLLWRESVYRCGMGQWEQVRDLCQRAIETAEYLGDSKMWEITSGQLASCDFLTGRYSASSDSWGRIIESARRRGDRQTEAMALRGQADNLIRFGDLTVAVHLLEEALAASRESSDRLTEMACHASLAKAHLQQERHAAARQGAEAAMAITPLAPAVFATLDTYANVAEVYLGLWERGQVDLRAAARRSLRPLFTSARRFPIAIPLAWRCRGSYEWLAGRPVRARWAWEHSLLAARQLDMAFDVARAMHELGRHADERDQCRVENLTTASEILSQIGAGYDLIQVHKALGRPMGREE
jgi:tetratricopeptide (TPR) repeat protein